MIKKLNFAGRWYPIIRVLTRKKLELKPPLPKIVAIDPTPGICNLRCPLCPTGNNTINFEKKMIEYENFTKILDKVHSATSLRKRAQAYYTKINISLCSSTKCPPHPGIC